MEERPEHEVAAAALFRFINGKRALLKAAGQPHPKVGITHNSSESESEVSIAGAVPQLRGEIDELAIKLAMMHKLHLEHGEREGKYRFTFRPFEPKQRS